MTTPFERGLADGLDPQPVVDGDEGEQVDGRAVTQPSSPWVYLSCTGCGHTFRRGDVVERDRATGRVRHLDPALHCAGPAASGSEDAPVAVAEQFARGLLEAWPTRDEVPVTVLKAGDWHLPDPAGGGRPPLCQGCGHTFRESESVVVCLCHPHDPGECRTAIHRDPRAGLPCWENTHPSGQVGICPWRLVRV